MKKLYTFCSRLVCTLFCFAFFQFTNGQNIYLVDSSHTGITTSTAVTTVNAVAWNNATGYLQAALDAAAGSGGQVWVKRGSYRPTAFPNGCTGCGEERDQAFQLSNNVAIYGGFAGTETLLSQRNIGANPTILSGDVGIANSGNDNSYHIVISVNNNSTAILDGFIVAGATAAGYGSRTIMGQTVGQNAGGGMFNANTSPTIANCTFASNFSSGSGGGMYNASSSPSISYCSFSSNMSVGGGANNSSYDGGGIANQSSSPVISFSRFIANYAGSNGGAIFNNSSSATIANCFFSQNNSYAGGAIFNNSSSASITNTGFSANNSSYGGGINNSFSSSVAITNCLFTTNTSGEGGAIYNNASSPTITNSTFFTLNGDSKWSLYNSNSNPVVSNSIFWNNNSNSGISNQSSSSNINFSIIKGGYPGTGNQNADPMFVNPADPIGADGLFGTADDGFALQCSSPAINTGSNAAVPAGTTTDITNAPRIQGGTVDVGAYEFQGVTGTVSLANNGEAATFLVSNGITTQFVINCRMIAALQPIGTSPVNGNVTAKAFVEAAQPNYNGQTYVKRHYEFTAANNPATATARITLYATQQEFNDFTNYGTNTNLPTGPNDMAGISRLRIFKYSGQSSNGTGMPGSYPQPGIEINPDDNNIIYNNALGRWEITFDVTGFSGFFIGNAGVSILPVSLLKFDGKLLSANSASLNWRTANEINTGHFELQRSTDGRSYTTISTIQATGTPQNEAAYSYTDKGLQPELYYYRLHIVDKDGKETFSPVITIAIKTNQVFTVYPVPAKETVWVQNNGINMIGKNIQLLDMQGRVLQNIRISQWPQRIDVLMLAKGTYMLKLPDETTVKIVKE